ncbi:MAG: zinc metalloprotease HtpX [Deltaproteobacteria bacterium]|nr:zinc metalloprotease HtpX [Deltaproteobacteria bacterium]
MANQIKTIFLLTAMTLVIMLLGEAMGGHQGLWIAFGLAMVLNFSMYWFSASIVLAQTRAKVVTELEAPELYQLVAHLAQRADLPMPRVAIMNDPAPNAFATGRNPSHAVVAVTTGILSILNREELAGVLGHELAHVKHRDILIGSVAAVLAGVIMLLAQMARFSAFFVRSGSQDNRGGSPAAGLLMALLAPLAASLIQAAISRSREYLADDGGADIAGSSLGLASALEKLANSQSRGLTLRDPSPATAGLFIVNPLIFKGISQLFATHPPIEERINRLRGLQP